MPKNIATPAVILAAQAMYENGQSTRDVAKSLHLSPATAWRLKHTAILDPEIVQHASKTIADKLLLSATAAVDTYLDKAQAGELTKERPKDLIRTATLALEGAGQYAALSGAKDMLANAFDTYGIQPSHSASRITLEQKVTVEKTNRSSSMQNIKDMNDSSS